MERMSKHSHEYRIEWATETSRCTVSGVLTLTDGASAIGVLKTLYRKHEVPEESVIRAWIRPVGATPPRRSWWKFWRRA